MPVTNLMNSIVVNALDEVLKKEDPAGITKENRDEILAYVLNRVPSKYVTSEQGLLYGILEARYKVQQQADILFLIYEAINKIASRRSSSEKDDRQSLEKASSLLPHIIGQVMEESSLVIVSDIDVSLLFKGKPVAMVDDHWSNPYKTALATKGHYHFWPQYSEKLMGKKTSISFTINFRHPKCIEQSIDISLETIPGADIGQTQFIPLVLMKAKNSGDFPAGQ